MNGKVSKFIRRKLRRNYANLITDIYKWRFIDRIKFALLIIRKDKNWKKKYDWTEAIK